MDAAGERAGRQHYASMADYCSVRRAGNTTFMQAAHAVAFEPEPEPEPEASPLNLPTAEEVWLFAPDFRKFGRSERHLWHLCHQHSRVSDTPVRFPGVRSLKHACLHAALKQNVTSQSLLAAHGAHSRIPTPNARDGSGGLPRWIEGRLEAPRVIRVVSKEDRSGQEEQQEERAAGNLSQRERGQAILTPETAVRVVYASYRVVLCVELSPSLLVMNSSQRGRVAADLVYNAVDMAMRAILQPVLATSVLANGFQDAPAGFPIVHLTVIARGLDDAPIFPLVLLRRLTLETESYITAMTTVAIRLRTAVESLIAQCRRRQNRSTTQGATGSMPPYSQQDSAASTLADSLHDCLFCLDQLPEEACPVVILVTDGTIAAPEMAKYENAVMHMTARDICCSIVSIHDPHAMPPIDRYPYGVVPDFASLNFLCVATGGTMTHATPEDLTDGAKGGEEFLLSTDDQLARRVKLGKGAQNHLKGTNRVCIRKLRFSIFVRCASLDGTRWRRSYGHAGFGTNLQADSSRISGKQNYIDRDTIWRWNQVKELRRPLDSLSSHLHMRFDEGFTVSHCELAMKPADPMDVDAVCKWDLLLCLQTVWDPIQAGIEWSVRASGRVEDCGGWAELPEAVQRLWLLNRLLGIQYDELGWISALEVPFEAGITRVDGQQVRINILGVDPNDSQRTGLDMIVGYRIFRSQGSFFATRSSIEETLLQPEVQSGRRQISKAVVEFIAQMASEDVGIDSHMQRLESMSRISAEVLDRQRHLGPWQQDVKGRIVARAEAPQQLIEQLHSLENTPARRCFHAVNVEFYFQPNRQRLARSADTREGTLAMIKTLHELLHVTLAHWCDVQGANERDCDLDLINFAPKDPEKYRTSIGRSYLKFLKPEDLGAEDDQPDYENQYGSGDDYDAGDDDDNIESAASRTRQPSFCFIHFAWFPSSHSFIVFFRFFRVPVHGTRARLCNFFIESLMQRQQSLQLSFDVYVAPKAMKNLSLHAPSSADPLLANGFWRTEVLASPAGVRGSVRHALQSRSPTRASLQPRSPPHTNSPGAIRADNRSEGAMRGPRILKINKNQRPYSEAALRSYLCKVTWLWTFSSVQGSEEFRTDQSIDVAKCTRAILFNWRAQGFRDTLKRKALLKKEILCHHDPLELSRGSATTWSHWQQWQHWHIGGNVRSIAQYTASHVRTDHDNAIQIELWVDPLSIQRQAFAMTDCYRLAVHTGERRDPKLANFYNWRSCADHDMSNGGARAVFEQMQAMDEQLLARFHSFDRITQLCRMSRSSKTDANHCSLCGQPEERIKRIIFTFHGARLCTNCSALHRVESVSPPHEDVSSKANWSAQADRLRGGSLWNSKVFVMAVPFGISSLLAGSERWEPRRLEAPVGGSWTVASGTDLGEAQDQASALAKQYFYDNMANALKSVSDFEMHMCPADCQWLAQHEGISSPARCFVYQVGTHRVLLSFVTMTDETNRAGVLVSTYCSHQPQTNMESNEFDTGIMESWKDRDAVCFRGDCEFCRAEGYEQSWKSMDASQDQLAKETVSAWYADLIEFLYKRVFAAATKHRLAPKNMLGVSPDDMQKTLSSCLQLHAEVPFPRLTTDTLPIDMDKVHHLVGDELRNCSSGVKSREAASQMIRFYEEHRSTEGDISEPNIASFYIIDKATSAERTLIDAIAGLHLYPLGPSAENLYILADDGSQSSGDAVSAEDLSFFAEQRPAELDRFLEPCLCDPEAAQAASKQDAHMSTWLRKFAHDLESPGEYVPPMFAFIGIRDICKTCAGKGLVAARGDSSHRDTQCPACRGQRYLNASTATNCVVQIRLYTLLPIVASHGGTRPVNYTMYTDSERIKTALPPEQKGVVKNIHAAVQTIASAVRLERMPVRFVNDETATLVSDAMTTLVESPSAWDKSDGYLLTREFRLQFVDSSEVRSRVAEELRSTNLLRLRAVKDGMFMLLQRPTVRRVNSNRVYEPSEHEADLRDALIPGALEQNVATDLPSPFWCILETSFEKSSVHTMIYSAVLSLAQKYQMLEDIDAALMCLSHRANVGVLLTEMSKTKRCRRLLYDPDPIPGKISLIREHCAGLLVAEAQRTAEKLEAQRAAEKLEAQRAAEKSNRRATNTSGTGPSAEKPSISIGSNRKSTPDTQSSDSNSTQLSNQAAVKSTAPNDTKGIADASARRPEEHLRALREKLKSLNQQGGAVRADQKGGAIRGARDQSERLPELSNPKPRGPTPEEQREKNIKTKEQCLLLDRDKMLDLLQEKLEREPSSVVDEIAEAAGLSLPEVVDDFDRDITPVNFRGEVPTNGRWQVDRLDDTQDSAVSGRYRFPLLHTIKLRLNERVEPKVALKDLQDELKKLKIVNRSAFVYEHEGTVFYLRLLQRDIPADFENDGETAHLAVGQIPAIFLAMYGIDTPSPQVRRALTRRLLNRLETLALNALSARLLKNLRFRVSPSDVTFICGALDSTGQPFLQQASSAVAFQLPSEVSKPDMLLSFIKQNLEQTKLVHELYFSDDYEHENIFQDSASRPVRSPDSSVNSTGRSSPVRGVLDLLLPHRRGVEGMQRETEDIQLFYNYKDMGSIPGRATPAQKNLDRMGRQYGEGVAFIFISIVPDGGPSDSEMPSAHFQAPEPPWPPTAGTSTGVSLHLCSKLIIRLWTKGPVKTSQLMNYVKVGVDQALHEYCLDVICLRSLNFQTSRVNLSYVSAAFDRALVKQAASVGYNEVDTTLRWTSSLAPCCTRAFVNEILGTVDTLGYSDVHVCIEAGDSSFASYTEVQDESFQHAVRCLPFERALVILGVEMSGRRSGTFYPSQHVVQGAGCRGDSFCLVISRGRVYLYTYNWDTTRVHELRTHVTRLAYWMCHRSSLLGQILASKMGLEPTSTSGNMETLRPKTSDRSTRTFSVAFADRASVFSPRLHTERTEWTGSSTRAVICAATDIPIHPLWVSSCADQSEWLASTLALSCNGDDTATRNVWPWLRLRLPPLLQAALQKALPPDLPRSPHAKEIESILSGNLAAYGTSMTTASQHKIAGGLSVPRLDIESSNFVDLLRRKTAQGKHALPTFSQIDWYHGPDLVHTSSANMLGDADHYQFQRAKDEFLGDYPPDMIELRTTKEPSEIAAANLNISPTKTDTRNQTGFENNKYTAEPFASPFSQVLMSPPRNATKQADGLQSGTATQVRHRAFSVEDAIQTRKRAQDERPDVLSMRPRVDLHTVDTSTDQLTTLLLDESLRRHLNKSDPVAKQILRGDHDKQQPDFISAHAVQLDRAAACGRREMRRHLHQSHVLQTLKSDALGLPGVDATVQDPSQQQQQIDPQRRNAAVSSSVDPDELEFTLAHSARLLHACRWPLLFNEACSLLGLSSVTWDQFQSMDTTSSTQIDDESHDQDIAGVVCQYRRLLESLLHFYTLYLRTVLDFDLVTAIPGDSMPPRGPPLPRATANKKHATILVGSDRIAIHDSPRVYLRKIVQGSDSDSQVIVMQIEFDGIFVCANIFAVLEWPPGGRRQSFAPPRDMRNMRRSSGKYYGTNAHSGARASFNTADDVASDVAQRMCLQPFLWDYHLHYACRAMLLRPPFAEAKTSPFAILPMLRMLVQHHTGTSIGSAPAGAIGVLTHTRRVHIDIPTPLIGPRAALGGFVKFLCADDQLLGCRPLHHPTDRGLGFCILAQQAQTAWQYNEATEAAVGVGLGNQSEADDTFLQRDCYFCVVSLEVVSPGSLGAHGLNVPPLSLYGDDPHNGSEAPSSQTGPTENSTGDVGATLSCEVFAGMASDLERYYPRLGARHAGAGNLANTRACSEAAVAFVKRVVVGGAKQYLRRLLWDTAAVGRPTSRNAGASLQVLQSPLPFGPLGSPRYALDRVYVDQMRHWISLCPARELACFDDRLELLARQGTRDGDNSPITEGTVPWCRFVVSLYEELAYDLIVAPANTDGHMTVVLCHQLTPLHAISLDLELTPQGLERRLSDSSSTAIGAASLEQDTVLIGADATTYLLGCGDGQVIMKGAAILGQRSLSAGGGAEKLAPSVVESMVNALILFVMDDVLAIQA